MGQVLHGCATTTEAVRRAIQNSQASLRSLAKRYGINPKTVAKWRKRGSVADLPTGPKEPRSTVLSIEDEALIVAFRRHTLLPLDDCLYALQATIPHLTRSSLHRCLQRHGIGKLPEIEATSRRRRSSRLIQSVSSTSTSPRCRRPKASSISSLLSTAPASSPSCNSPRRQPASPHRPSSWPSSPPQHLTPTSSSARHTPQPELFTSTRPHQKPGLDT
jgi:transposase-like protein